MAQCQTQSSNIRIYPKVIVNFFLQEFSVTKTMMWECHMDNSTEIRYAMTLGQYLLSELGLNLKFSNHVIKEGDGPFKRCSASTFHLDMHEFKILNTD